MTEPAYLCREFNINSWETIEGIYLNIEENVDVYEDGYEIFYGKVILDDACADTEFTGTDSCSDGHLTSFRTSTDYHRVYKHVVLDDTDSNYRSSIFGLY